MFVFRLHITLSHTVIAAYEFFYCFLLDFVMFVHFMTCYTQKYIAVDDLCNNICVCM